VVQILDKMIREKIKVEDFDRISLENDYYLWHFFTKKVPCRPSMRSIFDEPELDLISSNSLAEFLEIFDVPYFESYIDDSMDFLDTLGVPLQFLKAGEGENRLINPFMLTFNRRRLVNATYNGFCVCASGITKLLYDLNPKFIENLDLD
jgi:hypothetical protein